MLIGHVGEKSIAITSESHFAFQVVLLRQLMSCGNKKTRFQSPLFLPSAWLIKPMESWVLSVIAGAAFASFINSYDEERRSHSE